MVISEFSWSVKVKGDAEKKEVTCNTVIFPHCINTKGKCTKGKGKVQCLVKQ